MVEPTIEVNEFRNEEIWSKLKTAKRDLYLGQYDKEGEEAFIARNPTTEFKRLLTAPKLRLSSVGVGTYRGSLDATDDLLMFNAIIDSLSNGFNVVDTCRNFRGGRSEMVLGKALQYLIETQSLSRNHFFISSKVGYVRKNIPKGVDSTFVVNDHCVHPTFLHDELALSLESIGVSTLDVYYLNNFAEAQLGILTREEYENQLSLAFEFFEKARAEKKIAFYGLSSWQSLRVEEEHEKYVSLKRVIELAEKVGGKNHGMKFVQVPAFAEHFQDGESLLECAEKMGVNVISNSPFLGGSLLHVELESSQLKCDFNSAKHLQLIKSIPSSAIVSTLVGQRRNRHVRKNMQALCIPSLTPEEWLAIFLPSEVAKKPIAEEFEATV